MSPHIIITVITLKEEPPSDGHHRLYLVKKLLHNSPFYMVKSCFLKKHRGFSSLLQKYKYRVLQTIQMKLILLCVWAEPAVLGSTTTALNFKYEI